jgi:hypothetical protein
VCENPEKAAIITSLTFILGSTAVTKHLSGHKVSKLSTLMAIHGQSLFKGSVPALARRGIRNILTRTIAPLWTEMQTYDHSIKKKKEYWCQISWDDYE